MPHPIVPKMCLESILLRNNCDFLRGRVKQPDAPGLQSRGIGRLDLVPRPRWERPKTLFEPATQRRDFSLHG